MQQNLVKGCIGSIFSGIGIFFKGIPATFKNPKVLISVLVTAVVWFILVLLPRIGADILPVDILSKITFAEGGLEGSFLHRFGGFFGKGMIAAGISMIFHGGKGRMLTGFKNMGKGLCGDKGVLPFIVGIIMAVLVYIGIQGLRGFDAIPVAFGGSLLAIQAAGSRTGWIRNIALSWTAKKIRNVRGPKKSKLRVPNNNKAHALIAGLGAGWMVAAIIVSVITIAMPTDTAKASEASQSAGSNATASNTTGSRTETDELITEIPPDYKLKSVDICGEYNFNVTIGDYQSDAAEYIANMIIDELGPVLGKTEHVHDYVIDESTTIPCRLVIKESLGTILNAELHYNDAPGSYAKYKGYYRDQKLILYMYGYEGQRAADSSDTVGYEALQFLELDFTHDGATVMCSGEHEEGIPIFLKFKTRYSGVMTEPLVLNKKKVVLQSIARSIAGEDDGSVVPAIIVSVVSALGAAGAAGAAANSEADKKVYMLKTFKDFGDKLQSGKRYTVYARMVEVDSMGEETDRPDLSSRITISSEDEALLVQCGDGLSGNYKGAYVSVNEEGRKGKTEANVNFTFTGEGGSFTNSMKFFLDDPALEFNQYSIALRAGDTEIAEIGYKAIGFNPNEVHIDINVSGEGGVDFYEVKDVKADDPNAPAEQRFLLVGDKSGEQGTPGTYTVTSVTVTATEGDMQAVDTIYIYRVTEGLYVGADRIACYRIIKKESLGKPVQNLTDADMEQAVSKINTHILRINDERHELYYKPARDMQVTFEAADVATATADNAGDIAGMVSGVESGTVSGSAEDPEVATALNRTVAEKIRLLGLTTKLINITESASEYAFYCEHGYLASPHRYLCKMTASVTDPEDQMPFTVTQYMLLESQEYREHWEAMDVADTQMKQYMSEIRDVIYDSISTVGYNTSEISDMLNGTTVADSSRGIFQRFMDAAYDSNAAGNLTDAAARRINMAVNADNNRLDSEDRTLFSKLAPILVLIDTIEAGYDKHYGYDSIALATIRYQVEEIARLHRRDLLNINQAGYEEMMETANHDANSITWLIRKSFAIVSEKYVDTWAGMIARAGAGYFSKGLSELTVFPLLDANKAMVAADERRLLKDRGGASTICAGALPVLVAAGTYVGGWALEDGIGAVAGMAKEARGTGIRISAPPAAKQGFMAELQRSFVKAQTGFESGLANLGTKTSNMVNAVKNSSFGKGVAQVGQGITEMGQEFAESVPEPLKAKYAFCKKFDLKELKNLHYDPKGRCIRFYRAADAVDDSIKNVQGQAFTMIEGSRTKPLDPMCKLKSVAHDASELRAAATLERYKKAVDNFNRVGTDDAKEAMRQAYLEMQQDSLAINKLNQGIRTETEIINGQKISDGYIKMFNQNQRDFLKQPSEGDIKEAMMKLARDKGYKFTDDEFEIVYATGHNERIDLSTGRDIDISPKFKIRGQDYYFGQNDTSDIVARAWSKSTGLRYDGNPSEFLARLNGRAVTWEDPEFYHELKNVFDVKDVHDISLKANMKEGMYKLTHEYNKAQAIFDRVSADPEKLETAMWQIKQYQSRKIGAETLSRDALDLMDASRIQADCVHQFDKIRGIYEHYNIKAMGAGQPDSMGKLNRLIGKLAKQVDNQGMHHLNIGQFEAILSSEGLTWETASEMLMDSCEKTVLVARAADNLAAQAVQSKGLVSGGGVMNQVINNLTDNQ